MTAVRFQRRGDVHAVTFAYNPDVVETIKLVVPSFLRSWNPDRREWLILEPVYATQLADTLRRLGHTIIGIDDPPPQRQHTTDPAGWARAVFARVGPNRAPVAYRLLSKLCHPDTPTGDHRIMQELNEAFAEIERKKTA
jgi:hypothetical protein